MICIYSQNNTDYTKNGDAVLIPTRCEVSMTINGVWQLTMEHPYDPEERYKYIVEGAVVRCDIKCIRELPTVQQRFRIYTYTKGLTGITAIGFPVAMESTYDAPIDNLVISNKTGAQAMAALQAFTNKYFLSTDVTKTASMSMSNTNVNSAIASGSDNCFISLWGGEILYSNYDYMVKNRLGDNTAADHRIIYGRNLTNIEYKMDDSGLTTRIYPISNDGIRLNGTGYVDSPIASDYPVIHHRFMTAPYTLVDTNASSASATAQKTRQALAAVSSQTTTLSQAVDRSGYPPEYIKQNRNDIVSAVQTMALTGVISTSLYNALSKTIADAMAWMNDLAQPEWDWMGSYEEGWKYGNADGYAVNQYIKIGKKWCYFGANGNWQEPADSSNDWTWYQSTEEAGKRYGDFSRYYAHNEYVFITIDGQLKQYWFDKEGWYDEDKSGDSSYAWNGSGTAEDPWWFGESSSKYLKSCWAFIDGTYYFFDEYGYYDGSTKFADWQWDWVDDGANPWFGNPDETFAAIYITNQWCKIDGEWYYFDQDGYAYDTNAARTDVITLFTTGMSILATTVSTWSGELYTLLYSLMTSYAENKFAQGVDKPVITITVNMADLSKTTEYAGYENLETVKLGDSVECIDNEHNISTTNRVVGITYDVLRDYNAEITIGNATASVASIVGNAGGEAVAGGFDTSAIEAQINALQNKVGDIYMNGASIVSNGVGRFAIQAGSNISISRSGNTLTINSTAEGGNKVYAGLDEPSDSLGNEHDLYLRMKGNSEDVVQDYSEIGGGMVTYEVTRRSATSYDFHQQIRGNANWDHVVYPLHGLIEGNSYTVTFTHKFTNGRFYGGYTDRIYVQTEIESIGVDLYPNNESHDFSFTFTAGTTNGLVFSYPKCEDGLLIDSDTTNFSISGSFVNGIKDIYGKVDGKWQIYEAYEAGDNITIVDGVISATDTDEIAELEDVSLTDLADGQILKYNATTQKWENAEDSGGSEVEANPSETATDMLTKLGIDGTVYEIQGGSGSTYFGVFVDTQNVILPETRYTNGGSYTATQDCYGFIVYQLGSGKTQITLDGVDLVNISGVTNIYSYIVVNLAKGQTINFISTFSSSFYITVYGVKSGSEASYFQPIIYSTEEREVGVGENNKPLYQKTIESGSIPADSDVSTGLTNIESYHVIAIEVINLSNNTEFSPNQISMYNYQGAGTWYGNVFLTNNELKFINNSRENAIKVRAVIQYTKTTDTAGSGSYTTLGVPAHHYDGNEKVIGTWFGETLYEKTFDCGGLLNAQTKEISYTENMDTIIIVDAFAMSTNEGYVIPIPDVVPNYIAGSLRLYINKTAKKICIYTQTDMRTYDKSYVTLRYTKTS